MVASNHDFKKKKHNISVLKLFKTSSSTRDQMAYVNSHFPFISMEYQIYKKKYSMKLV